MQTPFKIKRILFPTDFSKSSQAVAAHVAGLARAMDATVSLINVVPWLPSWVGASEFYFTSGDDYLVPQELSRKAAEQESVRLLNELRTGIFQAIQCDVRSKTGAVGASIVEYATEIDADLIMMPTHSTGLRRFLIGATTARVLHDTRCPVWTSPHPRELDAFHLYRQVLCAVDYRVLSRNLLENAGQIARLFKSKLSIVSAVPLPTEESGSGHERESIRLLRSETQMALRGLAAELHLDASIQVLGGSVGQVVRQAAEIDGSDLIVIGRGSLDEPFGQLHTHAYEIIWASPCPVLSL